MNQFQRRGDDARRTAAADWVVRLQADDLTDEQMLAFEGWLDASADNLAAYDAALTVMLAYDAAAPQVLTALRSEPARRLAPRRGWLVAGGLAAAAALALTVLPFATQTPAQTFSTAKGEHRSLTLADGSTVDLNAGSTLTVSMGARERRITLSEGEAVFDVTADRSRPFRIAAGTHTVNVVGTRFDVRHRSGTLSVTVERGIVEVRPADGVSGRAFRLRPGQRLDYAPGALDAHVGAADPGEVFAWRVGRLVYRDRPLGDVVADLNQQFVKPIHLADAALASTPVTGVLVLDDQESVLRRLTLLLPLKALPSAQGVTLQRDTAMKP